MRTLTLSLALGGGALLIGTQLAACNALPDTCETYATCPDGSSGSSGMAGSSASGGTEGESGAPSGGTELGGSAGKGGNGSGGGSSGAGGSDAGAAGGGSNGCDAAKSPREEACLVADDFAVFVSPDGDDKHDGTQTAPFASLTKAATVAGERAILVCDATYDEHVVITNGARVYGGFKCTDWSAEDAKPLFKPTSAGPALKIDGVADAIVVEGVGFEVGDAKDAGETALTAIVNASPKVTFGAVWLKAGKGKTGANGTLAPFTFPARTDLDGNSATDTMGGAPQPYTCPGSVKTSGGIGGTASPGGQAGGIGTPDLDGPGGEAGQPPLACGAGGSGLNGANAPDAAAASGAKTSGSITPAGWNSTAGGDGANGSPGQGGGGGASTEDAGGGGGGAGACGGAGAKGGQGGGGSIALGVLDSVVKLEACELVTADAGDGGSSVAGQSADKPNNKGGRAGNGAVGACPGGSGGLGGDGAAGGGGAGGISVGIVWTGAKQPAVSADTTITMGKAGTKGVGGVPGTNDGIAGVAQKLLQLK
jgi:hypothetical protein